MVKSKQLKFSIIIVSLFLAVAALVTVILLLFYNKFDKIGEVETTPVDLNLYTDSKNYINDDTKTIYNLSYHNIYRENLAKLNCIDSKLTISGFEDEDIVQIVPKNLFCKVGETLHIGNEYGFYIKTQNVGTHYFSNVIVFDILITNNYNPYTSYANYLNLNIRELLNENFIYVSADLNKIKYSIVEEVYQYDEKTATNNLIRSKNNNLTINYNLSNDTVIWAPNSIKLTQNVLPKYKYASFDNLNLDKKVKYSLTDIGVSLEIFNEQALNTEDAGYDPYKDAGYAFNQSICRTYSALYKKEAQEIVENFHIEKEDQLNFYIDENNNPKLIKKVVVADNIISSCTNPESIKLNDYSLNNGGFEGKYRYSTSGIEVRTRLVTNINLKIADLETKEIVASGNFKKVSIISENSKVKLGIDKKEKIALFKDSLNKFTFITKYSSDFKINIRNAENLEVKIDGKIIEFDNDNAYITLNMGEYNIEIKNKTNERVISEIYIQPNVMG